MRADGVVRLTVCVRTDHPVRDFNGTGIILDVASTPPREEGNAELLAVCALTSLIALTYPLNSWKSLKRRGVVLTPTLLRLTIWTGLPFQGGVAAPNNDAMLPAHFGAAGRVTSTARAPRTTRGPSSQLFFRPESMIRSTNRLFIARKGALRRRYRLLV